MVSHPNKGLKSLLTGVLILIVMDNGLSLKGAKAKKKAEAEVLILIVMDNGLSLRQPES